MLLGLICDWMCYGNSSQLVSVHHFKQRLLYAAFDEAREGDGREGLGVERGKRVMPTSEVVAPRFLLIPHFSK